MSEPIAEPARVWSIDLSQHGRALRDACELLGADERERARTTISRSAAEDFTLARAALRRVLGSSLGVPAAEVKLVTGLLGKPELSRPRGLSFNLSHGGGLAVIAIGRAAALGVDVEPVPADARRGLAVAERFFAPEEVATLQTLERDRLGAALARLWSRKEAYVKALGIGLRVPLSSFALSAVGPPRVLRCAPGDPVAPERWRFSTLILDGGLQGTLAAVGAALPERIAPIPLSHGLEHLRPAPFGDRLEGHLAVT